MAGSGLSPRTVRWVHSVLRMSLDYAIEDGQLLSRNPAGRTKFPPLRQATHTYLTTSEVAALSAVCGAQGDVVSILAYTGLRFAEPVGLRVEDVDLTARRIRVKRSVTQVGGKLMEGNPKSAAGRRSIPIPERVMRLLNVRLAGPGPWRASDHVAQRVVAGSGELEARHPVAHDDRRDRPAQSSRPRPPAHLRPSSRAGQALTSGYCRRRWATRRSRSQRTSTPTSMTTNSTTSPRRSTRSTTSAETTSESLAP